MDKKVCKTCGFYLSLNQFYPSKEGHLGRKARCKICSGHDIWQLMYDRKPCKSCGVEKHLTDFYKGKGRFGHRPKCKDCFNSERKERYSKNPTKEKLKNFEWNTKNRDKRNKYTEKYRQSTRGKAVKLHLQRKRELSKLKRTPPWLSDKQLKDISKFYLKAKRLTESTGVVYHVDHIVPLQGKNVCGLHVPWNLQVIPSKDNLKKRNKV